MRLTFERVVRGTTTLAAAATILRPVVSRIKAADSNSLGGIIDGAVVGIKEGAQISNLLDAAKPVLAGELVIVGKRFVSRLGRGAAF